MNTVKWFHTGECYYMNEHGLQKFPDVSSVNVSPTPYHPVPYNEYLVANTFERFLEGKS